MNDLEQLRTDVEDGLQTELDFDGPVTVQSVRDYLDSLLLEVPGAGAIPLETRRGSEVSIEPMIAGDGALVLVFG